MFIPKASDEHEGAPTTNAEDATEDQEGAGNAEEFCIVQLAGNNHLLLSALSTMLSL